jgi:Skp family chaperone for outer membrane proteins
MLFTQTHKIFLTLLSFALLPCFASAQTNTAQLPYEQAALRYQAKFVEMKYIESEMELTEREVVSYNKELRKKQKEQEKMNDKAQRLKYKVARTLNRIDTTVEHRPTYAEWQLQKAEMARDRAAMYIANTEPVRQQKILLLGEKSKELTEAKANLYKEPHSAGDGYYRGRNIDKPKPRRNSQKIIH